VPLLRTPQAHDRAGVCGCCQQGVDNATLSCGPISAHGTHALTCHHLVRLGCGLECDAHVTLLVMLSRHQDDNWQRQRHPSCPPLLAMAHSPLMRTKSSSSRCQLACFKHTHSVFCCVCVCVCLAADQEVPALEVPRRRNAAQLTIVWTSCDCGAWATR